MQESKERIGKTLEAIRQVFVCAPSVPNWCSMCSFLAELVFVATQLHDKYVHESDHFRMAVGYLSLAPKRIPEGQTLSAEEWDEMNFYSESEQRSMLEAFEQLDRHLLGWVVAMEGDEELPNPTPSQAFASAVWSYRSKVEKGTVKIFKSPLGRPQFRSRPFDWLGEQMSKSPLLPKLDTHCLPQMREGEQISRYEREMLETAKDIKQGVRLLAGDAKAEGRGRSRVGTSGEIAQEDEILRRYRSAGESGLRGFVAQVVRDRQWSFPDGHPNTEQGRKRCYNRVYALINPLRRAKLAK